jgi:hypothetical protein
MILVILAIAIIAFIITSTICARTNGKKCEFMSWVCGVAVGMVLLATLIIAMDCSTAPAIEREIAVYEAENAKIEERISTTVSEYLTHEKDIMNNISTDITDPMAVVMAYPELSSSELVSKQISIWEKNNNEIKKLKSQKINLATEQWWLYFGGDEILESVDAKLEAELAKNTE